MVPLESGAHGCVLVAPALECLSDWREVIVLLIQHARRRWRTTNAGSHFCSGLTNAAAALAAPLEQFEGP